MNNRPPCYSPITEDYTKAQFIEAKELRKNMTSAEREIWHALKGERLQGLHFRRQQAIKGFIVDFYCHRFRLIIEVDGSIHENTRERNEERSKALTGTGMTILRFCNDKSSKLLAKCSIKLFRLCIISNQQTPAMQH